MAQVSYEDNGLIFIKKETGSAVSSISVDDCFSATYSQYKVIFNITSSATCSVRLRSGGTDSTTDYHRQFFNIFSTSFDGGRDTSWDGLGGINSGGDCFMFELLNPYQSTYTTGISQSPYDHSGNISIFTVGFHHKLTNSYDGLKVLPSSGTITGTIYIYGYKES